MHCFSINIARFLKKKKITIEIDASCKEMGLVPMQKIKLIAFFSKGLEIGNWNSPYVKKSTYQSIMLLKNGDPTYWEGFYFFNDKGDTQSLPKVCIR